VSTVKKPVKVPPYFGFSAEADVVVVADAGVVVGFGAVVAAVVPGAEVVLVAEG